MIDLHCHLLPAIDDGPPDLAGALALARAQVQAGVNTVVCTPHVEWQWQLGAAVIARGVDELRAALAGEDIPLRIATGGEVALTRALELPDDELKRLRLAGGDWLLLEAPLSVSAAIEQPIALVAMRGHRILLAHPERCPAFQRDIEALRRLVSAGTVRTQITASSLTGAFGSTVRRFTHRLMHEGLVDVVASDAHDAVHRGPGLREALIEAGFGEAVERTTVAAPTAIVEGGALPRPQPIAAGRPRSDARWPWRRRS